MENSYLNMAHVHARRADHHTKNRRFDEAIENHRKAYSYIEEAFKIAPQSPKVLESLQLQGKYHQKQVNFLRHKKQQFERYMKAVEYQRKRNPEYLAKQLEQIEKHSELQVAIIQNLENTTTLLESMMGSDREGDPALEDLVSLNHSLHVLVLHMTQNIDEYAAENETLKERLSMYEKEGGHPSAAPVAMANVPRTRERNALLEGVAQEGLAPLDLPTFDLPKLGDH